VSLEYRMREWIENELAYVQNEVAAKETDYDNLITKWLWKLRLNDPVTPHKRIQQSCYNTTIYNYQHIKNTVIILITAFQLRWWGNLIIYVNTFYTASQYVTEDSMV